MIADLWHAPDSKKAIGTATTGSSEAIMLGGLALKKRWQEKMKKAGKDHYRPNVIMGAEAQGASMRLFSFFHQAEMICVSFLPQSRSRSSLATSMSSAGSSRSRSSLTTSLTLRRLPRCATRTRSVSSSVACPSPFLRETRAHVLLIFPGNPWINLHWSLRECGSASRDHLLHSRR